MGTTALDDGTLHCPTGATLWFSELRQENAFTQRAVYMASSFDCQGCSLRDHCLGRGAKGNRARRVSAVRRLPPAPSSVEPPTGILGAARWVDVAGRNLRRTWTAHWRRQHIEVTLLNSPQQRASPTPFPSCDPLSSSLEMARSPRTQRLVGTAANAYHCCRRSRFFRPHPSSKRVSPALCGLEEKLLARDGMGALKRAAAIPSCLAEVEKKKVYYNHGVNCHKSEEEGTALPIYLPFFGERLRGGAAYSEARPFGDSPARSLRLECLESTAFPRAPQFESNRS